MTICAHCGTPLKPGALTCPNCGRLPFVIPDPQPKPDTGAQDQKGAKPENPNNGSCQK